MQLTARNLSVLAGCVLVMALGGWKMGKTIGEKPPSIAQTRTLRETTTTRHTVTVRVRGRVIRHHDHILVVEVPRYVFRELREPHRRVVIPAHVVRVRQRPPHFPVIIGAAAPPPVTVMVPVTVYLPGTTTTVEGPTTTTTATITVPTTITVPMTVTIPAPSGSQ